MAPANNRTRAATAGTFRSLGSDDMIQLFDFKGQLVFRIDSTGISYPAAIHSANVNESIWVDGAVYDQTDKGVQAAINSLGSGGVVYLSPGIYTIANTITLPPNVILKGSGMAPFDWGASSSVNPTSTTLFSWTGVSGGTMISMATPITSESTLLGGGGLRDLGLDGNGIAGTILSLLSVRHCHFRNLLLKDYTEVGLDLDTYANGQSGITSSTDTQHNHFQNLEFGLSESVVASQHGIRLQSVSSSGRAGGNTSLNTFINIRIMHKDGDGIRHLGDDNNRFYQIVFNQNFGGTGVDIHFVGTSDTVMSYENAYFGVCASPGGVTQEQYGNYNAVYGYTRSNGGTTPVVNGASNYFYYSEQSSGGGGVPMSEHYINTLFPDGEKELIIGTGGIAGTSAGDLKFSGNVSFGLPIKIVGSQTGFGNGSAEAVTTSAKGTGTGPSAPQTIANYLEISINGSTYWLPLVQ